MRRTARNVVVDFAELTDPGLDPAKQINEDACAFLSTDLGHLAVVCDGMGGHAGGREASQLAVRTITERFQAAEESDSSFDLLQSAIETASLAVHRMGGEAPTETRPGATCVAAIVAEPGALVAHVGDSRAVLIRGNGVYPLTRDHSMVQQLVDAGVIAPHEAANHPDANRITRALGMHTTVQVELASNWQPLRPDDVLLLTTDGVTDLVEPHELRDIVSRKIALGPAIVCQEVIETAKARGGHDNATIQVLHIVDTPQREERQTLDEPTVPGGQQHQKTQAIGTTRWSQAPTTSPTVVDDEPAAEARATEPEFAPPQFAPAAAPQPTFHSAHPAAAPPRTVSIRTGLFAAVGVALLVAMTAALALFVRFMRSASEDVAPPTEPASAGSGIAATELVKDPDPPPAPTATWSGLASAKPPPTASPSPSTSSKPAPSGSAQLPPAPSLSEAPPQGY